MRSTLTAQQMSFYTQKLFLELEIPHETPALTLNRDSFREDEKFKQFLLKTLAPLLLELNRAKVLRLGLTQWITEENRPQSYAKLSDMFSMQGFAIGAAIVAKDPEDFNRSDLGLVPMPEKAKNVLIFQPHLLLDWENVHQDVLLIAFARLDAQYIKQNNDPHKNYLKKFGYSFGDVLKNEAHPLIKKF